MHLSILSLISGLASLSLGSPCVTTFECVPDPLPAYTTLEKPFILRAQENFNVYMFVVKGLEDTFGLEILKGSGGQAEFTLKNGSLETTHGGFVAYFPPVPLIFPPVLNPVRFGKHPPVRAGFTAQHICHQDKRILVLTAFEERKFILNIGLSRLKYFIALVVRSLSTKQHIYTKPCRNEGKSPVRIINVTLAHSVIRSHSASSFRDSRSSRTPTSSK